MVRAPTDRPVLVAVANPDRTEQLVRTAGDLARTVEASVRIVSVVSKSQSSPFSVYTDDTIREHFAQETQAVLDAAVEVAPEDVAVEREVLVGRSVAQAVLKAVRRDDPRALVVGWHGRRSRTDAVFGTNLDRLVTYAPCDLYVERIGAVSDGVDSVLVPVAGGPHVRPATAVAKAIAARNDATVSILSVASSEDDSDTETEHVEDARHSVASAPGPDVTVETAVRTGEDVAETIVEAAADHDVVVFGVTRQSSLRRRLLGSIPERVLPRTETTVLLARSATTVGESPLAWVRALWRRP